MMYNVKVIFITYPRSGVNFTTKSIEQYTGTKIPYTHETFSMLYNKRPILTIVRNPKDSIASLAALQNHLEDRMTLSEGTRRIIELFAIPRYINTYLYLVKNADILIKHEDLQNIASVAKILSEKLNLDYKDIELNVSYEDINTGFIPTSKTTPYYQEAVEALDQADLSKCYELYYKALERCIDVS